MDAGTLQIGGIEMVETYRGRSHKLYTAATEQLFVATGARPDYQRISIADIRGTDGGAAFVKHRVAERSQRLADVGYLVVDYYLHIACKGTN